MGAEPAWPELNPAATPDGGVVFTPDEVVDIWKFRRDDERYHERAHLCHDTAEDPLRFAGSKVELTQRDIAAYMKFPGVNITISWETCGFLGDAYDPVDEVLHLCVETAAIPALARFVTAHEVAHAVTRQLGLAYTGNEEQAADELAAVSLILIGQGGDVLAGAQAMSDMSRYEFIFWMDTHPPLKHRARDLRCLVDGSQDTDWLFGCRYQWRRALTAWTTMLGGR